MKKAGNKDLQKWRRCSKKQIQTEMNAARRRSPANPEIKGSKKRRGGRAQYLTNHLAAAVRGWSLVGQ